MKVLLLFAYRGRVIWLGIQTGMESPSVRDKGRVWSLFRGRHSLICVRYIFQLYGHFILQICSPGGASENVWQTHARITFLSVHTKINCSTKYLSWIWPYRCNLMGQMHTINFPMQRWQISLSHSMPVMDWSELCVWLIGWGNVHFTLSKDDQQCAKSVI